MELKTALSSGLYRTPAFLIAGIRSGPTAALRAALLEFLLLAAVAGFTGAWLERLRSRPYGLYPRTVVFFFVPATCISPNSRPHSRPDSRLRSRHLRLRGPLCHLHQFLWHTMRNGAMLSSLGAPNFLADLRLMPSLIVSYLLVLTRRSNSLPQKRSPMTRRRMADLW